MKLIKSSNSFIMYENFITDSFNNHLVCSKAMKAIQVIGNFVTLTGKYLLTTHGF